MHKLIQQFLKFGVVGTLAFFIDYGLLVLFVEVFGVNAVVAAAISFTISLIFNYFASMRYVFTHRKDMSRQKEFAIFVILSVIGLGINEVLMYVGVEILVVSYLLVKLFATAVVLVWNFISRKLWLDAPDGGYELSDEEVAKIEQNLKD